MTRLLIRNGRVVDPSQGLDQGMDLLIEDGFVADLGEKLASTSDTPTLDAGDLVVAPGFITTAMTDKLTDDQKAAILKQVPAGRMGEAGEIGAAVLYLASHEAGYVTGVTLHVNGGMAML